MNMDIKKQENGYKVGSFRKGYKYLNDYDKVEFYRVIMEKHRKTESTVTRWKKIGQYFKDPCYADMINNSIIETFALFNVPEENIWD
jgi:hypothetical protein